MDQDAPATRLRATMPTPGCENKEPPLSPTRGPSPRPQSVPSGAGQCPDARPRGSSPCGTFRTESLETALPCRRVRLEQAQSNARHRQVERPLALPKGAWLLPVRDSRKSVRGFSEALHIPPVIEHSQLLENLDRGNSMPESRAEQVHLCQNSYASSSTS